MHRVVVTGIGILSGFGVGRKAFEEGLFSGRSAVCRIEDLDTAGLNCHFGAQVPGFTDEGLIRKPERQFYDRVSVMAMAAADEALEHAGLDAAEIAPVAGAMLGSAFGPGDAIQDVVLRYSDKQRLRPTSIVKMMLNSPTAALCARYGLRRGSAAHVTACAASSHAIAQAFSAIRHGKMELCLAGGAEAFPSSALYAAWDALAVMTPEADQASGIMKPFSEERRGFVIGEGAAILVLEREERARARGAAILAELCGAGSASDAPSLTKPTMRGMADAMRGALADAEVRASDIGHINAHGTATELNDALERDAIRQLFGTRAGDIAVSACKAAIGHCMGAGSALEAAATIMALRRQEAPCAVALDWSESGMHVPRTVAIKAEVALSNAFAFGGHYSTLAFRRSSDPAHPGSGGSTKSAKPG
jgi:3-oxoacyl-(acyl-carrier-protein) synthase